MKRSLNILAPIVAILLVVVILFIMGNEGNKEKEIEAYYSLDAPQLSFAPQGFPRVTGEGENRQEMVPEFDPRFVKLRPTEVFSIPRVTQFSAPIGTATGAFSYNAQRFWEFNQNRGGNHTGDDLNGIGGGNSDLGDPVFSIADGYVAYAGIPSLGWGKVVLIAHRVNVEGEEKIIQSMYAHLKDISVKVGDQVIRSQRIGRVGNADGAYLAHLHFEIREGTNLYIGPGYLSKPRTQLSPQEFLAPYLTQDSLFNDLEYSVNLTDNLWQRLEIVNPQFLLNLEE